MNVCGARRRRALAPPMSPVAALAQSSHGLGGIDLQVEARPNFQSRFCTRDQKVNILIYNHNWNFHIFSITPFFPQIWILNLKGSFEDSSWQPVLHFTQESLDLHSKGRLTQLCPFEFSPAPRFLVWNILLKKLAARAINYLQWLPKIRGWCGSLWMKFLIFEVPCLVERPFII